MPIGKQSNLEGIKEIVFGSVRMDAAGVQTAEMADARKGVLYFLSNTTTEPFEKPFSMGSSLLKNAIGSTQIFSDLASFADWSLTHGPVGNTTFGQLLSSAGHWITEIAQKIDREISHLFTKVLNKLAEIFGKFNTKIEGLLKKISEQMLSFLVGKIMGTIPGWSHLKTITGLYENVRIAATNIYALFSQFWSGYEVSLLGGHPDIIASALARHSATACATGLLNLSYESFKVGISATDLLTGIGSTLFNILDSVLMAIIKLVESKVQTYIINKSINTAEEHWHIRASSTSMIYRHDEFSKWFRNAVIPCPIIAALVLNSGFTAHPYRFLRLLIDDKWIMTQDAYEKGVQHIQSLKKIAKNYIQSYAEQYEFRFIGKDDLISSRLNELFKGRAFPAPPPNFFHRPIHLSFDREDSWEEEDEHRPLPTSSTP